MSTNEYFVSPALLRELDVVLDELESNILDRDITDYTVYANAHSEYRGFRLAMQLIKNLSMGYDTESVISRITGAFDVPEHAHLEEEEGG